jgi:hypothetical protein
MDEKNLIGHIDRLIDEEHRLRSSPVRSRTDAERARLADVEVALDQCWDLLRQRRARAEAGQDPDEATERPAAEVEGYLQ